MRNYLKILILLFSSSWTIVHAQENITKPAFPERIIKEVQDSASMYYYPVLLDKLKNNPIYLSDEETYFLYYGQISKKYFPASHPKTKEFRKLVMEKKCDKVISVGNSILSEVPLDLTTLLHTNICIKQTGQVNVPLENRLNFILSAVLSSGDGLTKESSYKIVHEDDAYIVKGALGLTGGTKIMQPITERNYIVWLVNQRLLYFELI